MAQRTIEIAEGGLERRAILDARGRDERVHLATLKALCAQGKTPADALLDGLVRDGDLTRQLLERCAM
jgi:glutamate--cysteine ligase